jgi:hypothetical protein
VNSLKQKLKEKKWNANIVNKKYLILN